LARQFATLLGSLDDGENRMRLVRRVLGGSLAVFVPACAITAYRWRPRNSADLDYHERAVSETRAQKGSSS
jgi:hypothetical protein